MCFCAEADTWVEGKVVRSPSVATELLNLPQPVEFQRLSIPSVLCSCSRYNSTLIQTLLSSPRIFPLLYTFSLNSNKYIAVCMFVLVSLVVVLQFPSSFEALRACARYRPSWRFIQYKNNSNNKFHTGDSGLQVSETNSGGEWEETRGRPLMFHSLRNTRKNGPNQINASSYK